MALMSRITDIILIVNFDGGFEDRKIKFLNLYLQSENHQPLDLSNANGGEKVFSGSIYVASFNSFNVAEFLEVLAVNFNDENDAYQVFVRQDDKYQFEIKATKVPKWI